GVLVLYYTTAQAFGETATRLLASYADQLAKALENAGLYEETQTQRVRLAQIFDSTSDGILLVNRDGEIQAANRQAGELLGFDASSVIGVRLSQLAAGRRSGGTEHDRIFEDLGAILGQPDKGGDGDLDLQRIGRTVHWVGRPIKDTAGTTVGFTLTLHDVTHERQVSQMKTDFVSFVTHQLRTPLAGIKWMLELAAQEPEVPADAASYIGDAREADPAPDHARERAARHLPAGARQAHGVDPAGGSRDHDPRGARGDRRPRAGAPASGLRLHRGSPAPRGARRRAAAPPGGHEPGLERDHARDRGHRPRALPRAPDHGAARRPRLVRVGGGRGLDLPLHAAARGARRVTSGRRVLLGDRVAGILEG